MASLQKTPERTDPQHPAYEQHLFRRFCVLLALSIGLITFDAMTHWMQRWRTFNLNLVMPLHFAVDAPVAFNNHIKLWFQSHATLVIENRYLNELLLKQQPALMRYNSLQKENKILRHLLGTKQAITYTAQVARILSIKLEPQLSQLLLNQGKKAGVRIGQAVIDSHGLMGEVVAVGENTATLMLISDLRSAIPVQDERTGTQAVAVGQGMGLPLKLINVPQSAPLKVGDVLFTSTLIPDFPDGYPVAKITKIVRLPGKYFLQIRLEPIANLLRSNYVLILLNKKTIMRTADKQSISPSVVKEESGKTQKKSKTWTISQSLGNDQL